MSNTNSALRHICERLVALEDDKAEIAEEIKITKAAAKSDGFDPALISKTVRLLRLEAERQRKELDQLSLFDTYLHAVGLIPEEDAA